MPSASVCINACDRPGMLWKTMNSLANQTMLDFEVVIVDDGTVDSREDERIGRAINILRAVGIPVNYAKNSTQVGLARSRNIARDMSRTDIVIKLDDDHYCDSDFVKQLVSSYAGRPKAGCIGSLFPLIHDGIGVTEHCPQRFGVLTDKWENQQLRLYAADSPTLVPADTVRGIMAYRRVPDIRHDERLSKISHREDTIFSIEYLRKGYFNFVNTRAVAYHLYAKKGGCRSFTAEEAAKQREADEKLYRAFLDAQPIVH